MTGGEQGTPPRITLYTKTDCELCHVAKATLLALQRELPFDLDEIDITTDPALYDAFQRRDSSWLSRRSQALQIPSRSRPHTATAAAQK